MYLQQRSPFYQRMFREHSIDISAVRDLSGLRSLPTTGKQDIQQHNSDFICVPPAEIREYVSTSGTMGMPVMVALTEKDQQRLAYNEYLSFQCLDTIPGDVFQLMLTLDRQFMAGMAYYGGLGLAGAAAVRTGPGLPAMQWDTIRALGTTGLVAVPSFLLKMIEYAAQKQEDPHATAVKKVLAIGESLRDDQLQPNALARKIQSGWNVKLYGTYASTEMQTAFTECSAGQGGHHHPELIIVELLDDEGRPVAPGERGEVVITTLGIEGMPLLRYRTGDICRAYYEPCNCGRSTLRLGPVLGRKQQMIKLKGTSLYPPALFEVLNQAEAVKEYVIEVGTDAAGQDDLTIHLHTTLLPEHCDAYLKPLLQHRLRVLPRISYREAEEIQRMQFPANSRKQVRFIDKRITNS